MSIFDTVQRIKNQAIECLAKGCSLYQSLNNLRQNGMAIPDSAIQQITEVAKSITMQDVHAQLGQSSTVNAADLRSFEQCFSSSMYTSCGGPPPPPPPPVLNTDCWANETPYQKVDLYQCYSPGYQRDRCFDYTDNYNQRQFTVMGASSWDFEKAIGEVYQGSENTRKALRLFRQVLAKGVYLNNTNAECTSDSDCNYEKTHEKCGTVFYPYTNTTYVNTVVGKCGETTGWWSLDILCSNTNDQFNPSPADLPSGLIINCTKYGQKPGIGNSIYGCLPTATTAGTCYNLGANTYCCGCVDWWKDNCDYRTTSATGYICGLKVPDTTAKCSNANSEWLQDVFSTVLYKKKAALFAYSYPFDDKTGGCTCPANVPNSTDVRGFHIVACPNNDNGNYTLFKMEIGLSKLRIVKFYNNCDYSIWPAAFGNSQISKVTPPTGKPNTFCNSTRDPSNKDIDCYNGTICAPDDNCHWKIPDLHGTQVYKLERGQYLEFRMEVHNPMETQLISWGGSFTARTRCSDTPNENICLSDCRGGNVSQITSFKCFAQHSFEHPVVTAEITFKFDSDPDYYDMQAINVVSLTGLVIIPDQHFPPGVIVI